MEEKYNNYNNIRKSKRENRHFKLKNIKMSKKIQVYILSHTYLIIFYTLIDFESENIFLYHLLHFY